MDGPAVVSTAALEGEVGLSSCRAGAPGDTAGTSNVETLEWLFAERKRLAEPGAGPADERYSKLSSAYQTPRFRALYRQWLDDPTNTLRLAGSRLIADNIDRGHGQVECVELSRQYLHLSPLVDVA